VLGQRGYVLGYGGPPHSFEMVDNEGHQIDVHPASFRPADAWRRPDSPGRRATPGPPEGYRGPLVLPLTCGGHLFSDLRSDVQSTRVNAEAGVVSL